MDAKTPFEKVQKVLEFVIDALQYCHVECSLQASPLHALAKRMGHCSDYHGFATVLLHSLPIPARVTCGVNPHKRRSPSHCRLKVFLQPYG